MNIFVSQRDWLQRSCLNFLYFGVCAGLPLRGKLQQRRLVTSATVQTAHGRESINTKIRLNQKSPRVWSCRFSSTWWDCEIGIRAYNLFSDQPGGEYEEQHLPAEHGRGELQTESEPPRSIWRVFAVQVTLLLQV